MNVTRTLTAALLASTMMLGTAATASAQPKERGAKVQQRMEQARARLLRHKVGLDEAKATQVEKILNQHKAERRKLQKQLREHKKTVTALLAADSNDQQAYARAITGFRTTEQKLRALRDKEFDALSKVLTPKQQAKLVVAAKQMQKEVRRRMQRRRGPRRP